MSGFTLMTCGCLGSRRCYIKCDIALVTIVTSYRSLDLHDGITGVIDGVTVIDSLLDRTTLYHLKASVSCVYLTDFVWAREHEQVGIFRLP